MDEADVVVVMMESRKEQFLNQLLCLLKEHVLVNEHQEADIFEDYLPIYV